MLAIAGCSASDGTTAQNKPAGVAERAPSADCSRFDYARCIALSPTERMRGVWLSGFERSSFLAGAEAVPNGPDRYCNRPEERRVGKEWVRTCRSRGAACH